MADVKEEKAKPRMFSVEEAIKLQDMLITGYMKEDYQVKIRESYKGAKDPLDLAKNKAEVNLTVQGPALSKFDFTPDRAGVAASVQAFNNVNTNPEVAMRNAVMNYLVDLDLQADVEKGIKKAPEGVPASRIAKPDPSEWDEDTGKVWRVVGGGEKGGIVVRQGEDTTSAECAQRLTTGAIIEELEFEDGRLKFAKIVGAGPDIGWVSIAFKGKPLVEPLWFVPNADPMADPKIRFKVKHDRVAKRETPNKDGKMQGMVKQGEKVSGHVVEENGVEWLKIKQGGQVSYLMINGESVGLGMLLTKMKS